MYAIKYFLVIPVRAYIVRTYRQLNTPGCGSGANGIAISPENASKNDQVEKCTCTIPSTVQLYEYSVLPVEHVGTCVGTCRYMRS